MPKPKIFDLSEKIADLFVENEATVEEGMATLQWLLGSTAAIQLYESHAKGGQASIAEMVGILAQGIHAYFEIQYNDLIANGKPS